MPFMISIYLLPNFTALRSIQTRAQLHQCTFVMIFLVVLRRKRNFRTKKINYNMGMIMERTVLNPAQMRILHMMSYIKTPQELNNLEEVLTQYFAKKVDEGIDELCDNGSISLDTIEEWGNEHLRASRK